MSTEIVRTLFDGLDYFDIVLTRYADGNVCVELRRGDRIVWSEALWSIVKGAAVLRDQGTGTWVYQGALKDAKSSLQLLCDQEVPRDPKSPASEALGALVHLVDLIGKERLMPLPEET